MKKIKLTKGEYAIVDDSDFGCLNKYHWHLHNGYARTSRPRKIYMHRLINETPVGLETDHINRNKLDNRQKNIRTVTMSQNKMNTDLQSNNTSGYKGVSWRKDNKKWETHIKLNKRKINLGCFLDIKDAILTRKKAELKYHVI